jgi:hypothetical protein
MQEFLVLQPVARTINAGSKRLIALLIPQKKITQNRGYEM